jgi:hypothetical protein
MATVEVERVGGFAGFGGPGSRLHSRGTVDTAALAGADRDAVEKLFARASPAPAITPDAFLYRLTRQTEGGPQTIEVAEQHVPEALRSVVKDRID